MRPQSILYLVKRGKNNLNQKRIKKRKKLKIKNRNYIKNMRQSMPKTDKGIFMLIPECDHSLIIDIPKDILQYNLSSYFQSFEKFRLRMVCTEFNEIFKDTQHILVSSINSDIEYWSNHSLSKYYKISPNYFIHLDLRHNKLQYMTKQEQIALKYFMIYNRNIENLLACNINKIGKEKLQDKNEENEENKEKEKQKDIMIEMTRISFSNSSPDNSIKNVKWISNVLQYYITGFYSINCLKILDLNYSGLNDECLLLLSQALISRKNPLNELEYLLLLNNIGISDKYIAILFEAIEKSCNNLSHLNFRRCNLGDTSCSIISNFYIKNHETVSIKHLDLELNTKITKTGTDKINKIFQINNKKLMKELVIHYGANKKSYCWECRTLYDQ